MKSKPPESSKERLGIAEVLVAVRRSAAVEADKARVVHERLDLIEAQLLGQHAEVAAMIPYAYMLFIHNALLPVIWNRPVPVWFSCYIKPCEKMYLAEAQSRNDTSC